MSILVNYPPKETPIPDSGIITIPLEEIANSISVSCTVYDEPLLNFKKKVEVQKEQIYPYEIQKQTEIKLYYFVSCDGVVSIGTRDLPPECNKIISFGKLKLDHNENEIPLGNALQVPVYEKRRIYSSRYTMRNRKRSA